MLGPEVRNRIGRLRRRCNFAVFVGLLLKCGSVYLAAAGLFTLAAKLFWPGAAGYLYLPLPGLVLPILAALVWLGREKYGQGDAAGISDRLAGLGGLLLTLDECDDAVWEEHLESQVRARESAMPRLRWAVLLKAGPYLAFLILALIVPQRVSSGYVPGVSRLEYEQLKKIERQLELINEEDLLPEEQTDQLKEEVERMLAKSEQSHEARWEAIDTVREKLSGEMEEVMRDLATAEQAAATGSREQVEKALKNLAEKGMLGQLPPELAARLGQGAQEFAEKGVLPNDPQALEAVREYMEAMAKNKCQKICQAGMCGGCAACQADLDEFEIAEMEGQGFQEGQEGGEELEGMPGRGGVTRGRGDAPMLWGDESTDQQVKFTTKQLPPVSIAPGDEMPVVGINIIDPQNSDVPAASGPGRVVDFQKVTGSEAWQRRVSPRHRSLVQRYFSGEKAE